MQESKKEHKSDFKTTCNFPNSVMNKGKRPKLFKEKEVII